MPQPDSKVTFFKSMEWSFLRRIPVQYNGGHCPKMSKQERASLEREGIGTAMVHV